MSTVSELERQLADARAREAAPSAAELERRLTAVREQEAAAVAAAEAWLAENVLAVKKLKGQLAEMLERVRANPNLRDVRAANAIWDKLRERMSLASVVARRFPDIDAPELPAVTAPGFSMKRDTGLSVESPARLIHPVVLASDSPELRSAIFARAADAWLRGNAERLFAQVGGDQLRAVIAVEAPEPDLSERVASQRAESARQRALVEQLERP